MEKTKTRTDRDQTLTRYDQNPYETKFTPNDCRLTTYSRLTIYPAL